MADLLKYRYIGDRDNAGVPLLSMSHPLYGAIPARDLYQSDIAGLHAEQVGYVDASPLYQKVSQAEARSVAGEEDPADGNASSPGLPQDQREDNPPPGSDAAGPTGEVPAGPPTNAEAQIEAEREMAENNPAILEHPPVARRSGRNK